MVVVEKMVAFAIVYGGEFEWNNVIKFYILKACVCVSTIFKKKKKRLWKMILLIVGVWGSKWLMQRKYVQLTLGCFILEATI